MQGVESNTQSEICQLLFVGGFPGGGTDLLKTIINAHPEIELQGEAPLLYRLLDTPYRPTTIIRTEDDLIRFRRTISRIDIWTNLSISKRSPAYWHDFLPITVERLLFFPADGVHIVGNKTPQNTEHIIDLHRLFGNAKFIIIMRDVRDVALSWNTKWGKDPYHCSIKWADRMRQFVKDMHLLPAHCIHVITFESLLDDTETVCRGICTFLGVDWHDNMMRHDRFVNSNIDGKVNYGKPLKKDNKGKWRNGSKKYDIKAIEEIAFTQMCLLGYRPVEATCHQAPGLWRRIIGYLRDAIAIVVVGNREAKDNRLRKRIASLGFQVRRRLLVTWR